MKAQMTGVRNMTKSGYLLMLSAIAVAGAIIFAGPSQALTMKECSAKYEAAKKSGTLKGMKWNDFRKAECSADAAAAKPAEKKTEVKKPEAKKVEPKSAAKPAMAPSRAVFPTAVSPKYSKESAGKARMHTCLDQYNANKATNANGSLKWTEKGGGYYSECNKRLKG
jgi:hypothetical protein